MSQRRQQRQLILLTCLRTVLWALIVVSFMAFFFALFVRPTAWFSQNKGGQFGKLQSGLTLPWHALASQTKNVTAPVLAGTNMSMVRAEYLACVMAAAVTWPRDAHITIAHHTFYRPD